MFFCISLLFCNCALADYPILKDINFKTKCLLVWCEPAITSLVRAIFGINHPCSFWKLWNCPLFTKAILKLLKMYKGNLSQIILPKIWLLVLIIYLLWNFCNILFDPSLRSDVYYIETKQLISTATIDWYLVCKTTVWSERLNFILWYLIT